MGFGQGLSGLKGAAQKLDVIGNNIANSGTVGFKSSTVSFADVYANSRVGLGTQVAAVNQNFSIGTISNTGGQFDMAIDGDRGMFRVTDQSGQVMYTRNGEFSVNKEGYLVNPQGYYLTGYVGESTTPERIRVPYGNIAPQATSTMSLEANFNANSPAVPVDAAEQLGVLRDTDNGVDYHFRMNGDTYEWVDDAGNPTAAPTGPITSNGVTINFDASGQPTGSLDGAQLTAYVPAVVGMDFDPTVPGSFTHVLPMTVYDSLGNSHQLTQYFVKRDPVAGPPAESVWDVHYLVDGNEVTPTPAPQLRFDEGGRLTAPTAPFTLNIPLAGGTSPAEPLAISVDYAGSTQFGGEFKPDYLQNGYATGEYSSLTFASDGSIVASYTNGEVMNTGTLALAHFNNLQGMKPVGGNAWIETAESGPAILGTPGSMGFSTIKGQALEESNVDMGTELVNMIITQRVYQANAQTITTQSEMMQTLINIR